MPAVEEKRSQTGLSIEAVVQATAAIEDEESFPDGGLRAWLVVVGCFVVSAVVVGFWYVFPFHISKCNLPFSSFVSVALT